MASIDTSLRYSELWLGTHPSGPSLGFGGAAPLTRTLSDFPGLLSAQAAEDVAMSFTLKAVSVGRSSAIRLAAASLVCAVTDFSLLVGFESADTIVTNLRCTPELCALLRELPNGSRALEDVLTDGRANGVRALLKSLASAPAALVASQINALRQRVGNPCEDADNQLAADSIAMGLNFDHLHDVGVFFAYFMCHRTLSPGQTLFIDADEPHAYLSGDCVQVTCSPADDFNMAVLALGSPAALSPDVTTTDALYARARVSLLAANQPHPANALPAEVRDEYTHVFSPPADDVGAATAPASEFQLERIVLPADSHHSYLLAPSLYGALVFVLEGMGEARWNDGQSRVPLSRGMAFFQPALSNVKVLGQVTLFRAVRRGCTIVMQPERKYEMYREERKRPATAPPVATILVAELRTAVNDVKATSAYTSSSSI